MKYLQTVLLLLIICGIGLAVFVRLDRLEARLQTIVTRPSEQPISAILRDMSSHGQLISDDQAKAVSLEVWTLLWGTKYDVKVTKCSWDEQFKTWVVSIDIVDPASGYISGTGCAVTISERGELEKVEATMGL